MQRPGRVAAQHLRQGSRGHGSGDHEDLARGRDAAALVVAVG